jgi:YkoY family integral membrane protein
MFETYFSIIASLFIIEVLLSIDNALVNATIAHTLPEEKRHKAIRIGILLGSAFRVVALFAVAIIIHNVWIKIAGAFYLIYLAISHLGKTVDEEGEVVTIETTFKGVVIQIALADIVFSIDNVISAVSFSSNTILVIIGVLFGVVSMLFITPLLSKLIHAYKGMPQAAYVIVGLIGVMLCVETFTNVHIRESFKFMTIIGIVLFTILYEHSLLIRQVTHPVLKKMQYVIAIPLDIIYSIKNAFDNVRAKLVR